MRSFKENVSSLILIFSTVIFSQQANAEQNSTPLPGARGCGFKISSSGGINCPAGQLSDGQIRLNGTQEIATLYILDGKITDSENKGCIVTGPPTTQIQCDDGKSPDPGFSIDSNNLISWKGSSNFSACPATDTEYNIYADPDFGQSKCFGITLHASECGTAPPSSSCALPEVPSTITVTSVVTAISSKPCIATETSAASVPSSTTCTVTSWLTSTAVLTYTWTEKCSSSYSTPILSSSMVQNATATGYHKCSAGGGCNKTMT